MSCMGVALLIVFDGDWWPLSSSYLRNLRSHVCIYQDKMSNLQNQTSVDVYIFHFQNAANKIILLYCVPYSASLVTLYVNLSGKKYSLSPMKKTPQTNNQPNKQTKHCYCHFHAWNGNTMNGVLASMKYFLRTGNYTSLGIQILILFLSCHCERLSVD